MFSAASLCLRLATRTKQFALSCGTSFKALSNRAPGEYSCRKTKRELLVPTACRLAFDAKRFKWSKSRASPGGSRARLNRVRVSQVRVCEPGRSAPVEKANARDAIMRLLRLKPQIPAHTNKLRAVGTKALRSNLTSELARAWGLRGGTVYANPS